MNGTPGFKCKIVFSPPFRYIQQYQSLLETPDRRAERQQVEQYEAVVYANHDVHDNAEPDIAYKTYIMNAQERDAPVTESAQYEQWVASGNNVWR